MNEYKQWNYDDYDEAICSGIHHINNIMQQAYHEENKAIYKNLFEEFHHIFRAINCLPMNEKTDRFEQQVWFCCIEECCQCCPMTEK